MDTPKKSPTVLSFCTGYGGIERGLERVFGKISVLAHVEIEAYADANLINKMENLSMVPSPLWTDLKTFRPRIFRGCVDILTGGYPCQPFSNAGRRKGSRDPRHLWPWIRSAIKVIRPGMCFFENVEGHVSLGLREVLTDLVKLGYRVENDCGEPTWGLFSAAEVGAPHQRKRVFVLAYRKRSEWRPNLQREYFNNWDNRGWTETTNRFGTCRKELEYAGLQRQAEQEQQATGIKQSGSDKKLGNSESDNERRPSIATMHRERIKVGGSGRSVGLADTCCKGSQGTGYSVQERRGQPCPLHPDRGTDTLWPARPGEEQYEWEEPRVLADTDTRLRGKQSRPNQRSVPESNGKIECTGGETEPQLGRTIDGFACRVDRLRLLGNGVVPQTAERAFRVLFERIVNPDENYVAPSVQLELFGGGL